MYGTHSVTDLLGVTNQTVAQFGENLVADAFAAELAAHNVLTANMLAELCDFGDEQINTYGGQSEIVAIDTDEFGSSDAQKTGTGTNIGFPLRNWDVTLQWTRLYMEMNTPADLAKTLNDAKVADLKAIQRGIRRALYTSTNNLAYVDVRSKNRATLPIRALLNGDGTLVPAGPNGDAFATAHNHYLGTASLTAANVSALITTVQEHGLGGELRLYINGAQEAAIRAMTANFTPYYDSRITMGSATATAAGTLQVANTGNRAIGIFDAAEVWVKPWVLASYPVAIRLGGTGNKPIRARTRTGALTGLGAFDLRFADENYPLRTEVMSREIGFGIHERADAAVLFTAGASYTIPATF